MISVTGQAEERNEGAPPPQFALAVVGPGHTLRALVALALVRLASDPGGDGAPEDGGREVGGEAAHDNLEPRDRALLLGLCRSHVEAAVRAWLSATERARGVRSRATLPRTSPRRRLDQFALFLDHHQDRSRATAAEMDSRTPCSLLNLPPELAVQVVSHLDFASLSRFIRVSRRCHDLFRAHVEPICRTVSIRQGLADPKTASATAALAREPFPARRLDDDLDPQELERVVRAQRWLGVDSVPSWHEYGAPCRRLASSRVPLAHRPPSARSQARPLDRPQLARRQSDVMLPRARLARRP